MECGRFVRQGWPDCIFAAFSTAFDTDGHSRSVKRVKSGEKLQKNDDLG